MNWSDIYWRNTLFFIGTAIATVVLVPWYIWTQGLTWPLVAMFVIGSAGTCLSITAGYHRFLAHRSFHMRPWVKNLFLLFGAGAFQSSALWWASEHRRHHRFVDTEQDPHNIREGFMHAHIGWMMNKSGPTSRMEFSPDLLADRWIVWQHEHYVPLAIFMGFIVPLGIGYAIGSPMGGLIFGGVARIFFTNHVTFFINSLAHTLGTRPYSDKQTARDSWVMAFLAFGEGYHNYHHVFAADYRNGIRWYQWDPTKWLILSMSWVGMTYRLRRTPPAEILRARLQNEQIRLVHYGMSPETVAALKQRVEEAQARWRQLKEDYRTVKKDVQARSLDRLARMKADMKVAKLEFHLAWKQWSVYRRALASSPRLAPSYS